MILSGSRFHFRLTWEDEQNLGCDDGKEKHDKK